MPLRETAVDTALKLMNTLHRSVMVLSGGRALQSVFGMPTVELHTIGRVSGLRRSTLLTAPVYEPDRVVFVASKGGDDRHPDWYRNLSANPRVELTVRGVTRVMVAHTASPSELAELWPQIVGIHQGYGGYQRRTERELPVVVCEPLRA